MDVFNPSPDNYHTLFTFTSVRFFEFNQWWLIRQVDHICYNSIYSVADLAGARMQLACAPQPLDRVVEYVLSVIGSDDWVDVVYLDGTRVRNVQWHAHPQMIP